MSLMMIDRTFNYTGQLIDPCPVFLGTRPNGNDDRKGILKFNGEEAGIIYDGRGVPYRATGGEFSGFRIARGGNIDGGIGLLIAALNGGERPGEVRITDLRILGYRDLVSSLELARWAEGLVIDGSLLTTPGAAGVRFIDIVGLRVSSCVGDGDFIRFHNCTHLTGAHIQVDPGRMDEGKRARLRIIGGQNIFLDKLVVNGDVIVEGTARYANLSGFMHTVRVGSDVDGLLLDGHINTLIVDDGARGRCHGLVATVQNDSSAFEVI